MWTWIFNIRVHFHFRCVYVSELGCVPDSGLSKLLCMQWQIYYSVTILWWKVHTFTHAHLTDQYSCIYVHSELTLFPPLHPMKRRHVNTKNNLIERFLLNQLLSSSIISCALLYCFFHSFCILCVLFVFYFFKAIKNYFILFCTIQFISFDWHRGAFASSCARAPCGDRRASNSM